MATDYIDFLFVDEECGEEFFVELECDPNTPRKEVMKTLLPKARQIANDNFDRPTFIQLVPPEVAEMMGYDTY